MDLEKKNQIQLSAFKELLKYKRVILKWSTGSGKTMPAIHMLNHLFDNNKIPRVLIVIAEKAHKNNWKNEINIFSDKAEQILNNITIICYASLKKYINTSWDFIVFDETHHLKSELRQSFVSTIKSRYILALSATLPLAVKFYLNKTFGNFLVSSLSLKASIDNNLLSEPTINIYTLSWETLNLCRHTLEINLSKNPTKIIKDYYPNRWKYLRNKSAYKGCKLILYCTAKEKYEYYEEQINYYKRISMINPNNQALKNLWLQYGSLRKRYLGELKTETAKTIINKMRERNSRFITFCCSINQSLLFTKECAVNSKNPESFKLIDSFNKKELSELFAVGMLQEGVTLSNLEECLIIQLDGNERGFIQKTGRAMRAEHPMIHLIVIEGTQDTVYLKNVTENVEEKYIKVIKI